MNRALESALPIRFPRRALLLALVLAALTALTALLPARAEPAFLEPEQAFRLQVQEHGDGQVRLQWDIAPGYYLYRDRIQASGEGLGTVDKPRGETKADPNFGTVEVYHDAVEVRIDAGSARRMTVTWQGCAEDGLCYPPERREIALQDPGNSTGATPSAATGGSIGKAAVPPDTTSLPGAPAETTVLSAALGNDTDVSRVLAQRSLAWTLPVFFVLGIALAFTPCVLPMVPILSSMVVGSDATPRRGLALSLAFVLPMAAVYAALGVLAAWAGSGLQAWLQNPWTLLSFAAVFVVLAAAMFGFFELQLPAPLRDRLANASPRGGSLAGAAGMGMLSAILVGPCMTAPLAGTLLYIAQGGSALHGAVLLLALGLGMGVPLVVISTLGARWLPRPGAWMNRVKAAFGFILLGTAVWMAERVLPPPATLLAWGALLVGVAWSLWHAATGAPAAPPAQSAAAARLLVRSGATLAGLWGAAMVLGATAGASDPAQPLRVLVAAPSVQAGAEARFETVPDPALLQARLAEAAARGQPALVEFSADWCTACKTIEREVFGDARVVRALDGIVLLRADVTRSDAAQRAFMQRHQVMGPPTLMLFDAAGQERRSDRLVGEFAPQALLERLSP